jgi:short-subunit dehydrogenase
MASFQPVPAMAVYAATKAFTLSLGEALGEELRDTGVLFTTLCPGFTDTQMVDAVEGARDLAARIPAGIVLDPERVAREAYRACMDGVAVHIPGITNQLAVQLMGWQPRWLVRALGGFIGRRVM